eukprot:GFKZ01016024.1.p1 GENE.GFKZ01016024.1~~GFKZ01016024.1.p1  ORF type:complete len:159 (-),score=3.54 GFKZ01016024.1:1135-1611(-)
MPLETKGHVRDLEQSSWQLPEPQKTAGSTSYGGRDGTGMCDDTAGGGSIVVLAASLLANPGRVYAEVHPCVATATSGRGGRLHVGYGSQPVMPRWRCSIAHETPLWTQRDANGFVTRMEEEAQGWGERPGELSLWWPKALWPRGCALTAYGQFLRACA